MNLISFAKRGLCKVRIRTADKDGGWRMADGGWRTADPAKRRVKKTFHTGVQCVIRKKLSRNQMRRKIITISGNMFKIFII